MQPSCQIFSEQRSVFTNTSVTVSAGRDAEMVEKLTTFDERAVGGRSTGGWAPYPRDDGPGPVRPDDLPSPETLPARGGNTGARPNQRARSRVEAGRRPQNAWKWIGCTRRGDERGESFQELPWLEQHVRSPVAPRPAQLL